ncbi:cytochrome o ubiquinol oxidase subunit IV [Hansschlegelia beijingensis]|uniref:Cytochrome bo(3) ubiquinol oxidase subunit 4 n=1 Tax=Hansschlegelia beijingensis TaxID=1133344 RepID=A0A7W6GEL7_9HYPH|nr:cytochrome o ubiquinol oxidase subunit IV [Hansschlegelia beijingensis]MBB3972168.1 cytochrome o ubiquinol oxidase operon protein cyoD [Hansschlegelia beijingensis]
MSADAHAASHEPHGAGHGHELDHSHASHGTMRGYLLGFFLSVILTAIPFWLVMGDVFRDPRTAAITVLVFAAMQIVVHMIFFLHMNTKSEGGWTMLAAIFTIVIVVITLAGSFWVMFHLNANMMPAHVPMEGMGGPAGMHDMTPGVSPPHGGH